MPKLKSIPDIVIRPSGVWDSRTPYRNYFALHRRLTRLQSATALATWKLRLDAEVQPPETSLKTFFKVKSGKAGRAWIELRDTLPDGTANLASLQRLLNKIFFAVTEHSLVKYSALFETYIQCWALNYLLAKLEAGEDWTGAERSLAERFWPRSKDHQLPTLPHMLNSIPSLQDWLAALPHVTTDLATHQAVMAPVSPTLNALSLVRFWRGYRNLVMHRGGVVSKGFLASYGAFFEEFAATFKYVKTLKLGDTVDFSDGVVVAIASVQNKAARFLDDQLARMSRDRRGHVFAPANRRPFVAAEAAAEPWRTLLLDGDHDRSLQFVRDTSFANETLAAIARASTPRAQRTHKPSG